MSARRTFLHRLRLSSADGVDVRVSRDEDPWAPSLGISLGEYRVYDAELYDGFDADKLRTERYRAAIAPLVKNKVVLDIGSGGNLLWARTSLELGARKVFAIEELKDACDSAARLIDEQRLNGRVELIRGNSMQVQLPERADVCISEIIGFIGSAEGARAVLSDARKRHLKPDAKMVPERVVTRVAGVRLPEALYAQPALHESALPYLESVFQDVGHCFDIRLAAQRFPPEARVTTAGIFEEVHFSDISVEKTTRTQLTVTNPGRLDGLLLWIELYCGAGQPPIDSLFDGQSWDPVFLPMTYPGITVETGDVLTLTTQVTTSDDGVHPDFNLTLEMGPKGLRRRFEHSSGHHAPRFRDNPFTQALFSPVHR